MSDERRASPRIPVEMWVEESTERELYFQRGANISVGGLYLQQTIPHPKGTRVNLRFTLPGEENPVEVKGEIVNVSPDEPLGMGVKFLDLRDVDRLRIEHFVHRAQDQR